MTPTQYVVLQLLAFAVWTGGVLYVDWLHPRFVLFPAGGAKSTTAPGATAPTSVPTRPPPPAR